MLEFATILLACDQPKEEEKGLIFSPLTTGLIRHRVAISPESIHRSPAFALVLTLK